MLRFAVLRMSGQLRRALVAECLGTALLAAAVVGSGIMGERLSAGNGALALLANAVATGAALFTLILTFGSISGAHFNPAVSIADASQGGLAWRAAFGYTAMQVAGALAGVALADYMFGEPVYGWSTHARGGLQQVVSEAVAAFGLVSVIWGVSRRRADAAPFAVAAFITAAYWFTPSTSFANPALTVARAITNTFAGLRPADVMPFIAAQATGAAAATMLFGWLVPAAAPAVDIDGQT